LLGSLETPYTERYSPLMRLLLVSYFYSPLHTVAAERWRRFVDRLTAKDHKIEVLTGPWEARSADGRIHYLEDSFSDDAQRLGKQRGRGTASGSLKRVYDGLSSLVPVFLLIDGKWRWSFAASQELRRIWSAGETDLVIITGTPWSSVAVCAAFCRLQHIPYIIDFRDLWADEPYLRLSSALARKYFSILESQIIAGASGVMTVNAPMAEVFRRKARPGTPVDSFPNGFDGALAHNIDAFCLPQGGGGELMTYAGSTSPYSGFKDFLKTWADVGGSEELASLGFFGDDPMGDLDGFPQVKNQGNQSSNDVLEMLRKRNVLLLTLAEKARNYTTGKLMTYVAAQRPILYYGPAESPAAALIRKHGLGWVVPYGDRQALGAALAQIKAATATGARFDLKPDFVSALSQVGIVDEASYLEEEHRLPFQPRFEAGVFRYRVIIREKDDDPCAIARAARGCQASRSEERPWGSRGSWKGADVSCRDGRDPRRDVRRARRNPGVPGQLRSLFEPRPR
jgi:glycosyltransferase involved in cell wall biosynthesis